METMAKEFVCGECGKAFTLAPSTLARYPGWTPRQCLDCRGGRTAGAEENLTPSEVLDHFQAGPDTGVFTDGSCEPNPGPGGWGAVKVIDGEIVQEEHGHKVHTTNNQMELKALIEGYQMLAEDEELPIYSDSALCVNTITKWASGWERNGWTRGKKREAIKNLELVQELYAIAKERPKARLQWIKAHEGSRWNEYADSLSRAYKDEAE